MSSLTRYINKMKEVQTGLLKFIEEDDNIEENFQNLEQLFIKINLQSDLHELKDVLNLIGKISDNHKRQPNFFGKIEKILLLFKNAIKNNYSNLEIFNIFKNNKRILLFLFDEQIIMLNDEISNIFHSTKYDTLKYPHYFAPEIKSFLGGKIEDKCKSKNNNILEEISCDIPQNFDEKRRIGENDDIICQLIRNDSINEFINYVKKNKFPLDSTIPASIYETNDTLLKKSLFHSKKGKHEEDDITLIKYAAFFGSIQIFKYLRMNKITLKSSILLYAIHGNNLELIQFLEDNHLNSKGQFNIQCYKEAVKCHHNSIATYFKAKIMKENEKIDFENFFFKYFNFLSIQTPKLTSKTLFYSCKYDHYHFVKFLLSNTKLQINKRIKKRKISEENFLTFCECSETPLNSAVKKGHLSIVKLLLKHTGIEVNKPTKIKMAERKFEKFSNFEGWRGIETKTALIYSIENENIEMIKLLLESDYIDVNYEVIKKIFMDNNNNARCKEFSEGIEYHKLGVCECTKSTALITAVQRNNEEIVRLLLNKHYVNIDYPYVFIDYKGGYGYDDHYKRYVKTPLNIAVSQDNVEIVKILLNKDADPDIKSLKYTNMNNCNDIDYTNNREFSDDEIIEDFFDDEIRLKEKTPLMIAIGNKNVEMVCTLLDCKEIDLNELCFSNTKGDTDQKTALFYAIEKGNEQIVKLLLEQENIDVNLSSIIGEDEKPVLFLAIDNHNTEIIKLLLEQKDLDLKLKYNVKGDDKSVFDYAIEKDDQEIIQFLEDNIDYNNECEIDVNSKSEIDVNNDKHEIESLKILVEPIRKNLERLKIDKLTTESIEKVYGKFITTSMKTGQQIILDYGNQPVLQGFVDAYRNHRPITISPDIIWLLIIQAFANHVTANAEKLRTLFVNFDGQKELVLDRQDLNFFQMESEDYEKLIFPDFVKQIAEYTGNEIVDSLTPNFTTTTHVSLAVGQISIMSAMKNYFKYRLLLGGCGFPYITIEGSLEDWLRIIEKLNILQKYQFEWFTNQISEIVYKIIDSKRGNIDKDFWKNMIRIKEPDGTYEPTYIDGWFINFFPYNFYGKIIQGPISETEIMPSEMLSVPFILKVNMPGIIEEVANTVECEILAGFVGLSQNRRNACLKPEIGWILRKKPEIAQKNPAFYQREEAKKNRIHLH